MKKNRIISLFLAELGCKNRCVFCNQNIISGVNKPPTVLNLRETIETYIQKTNNNEKLELAFYGGTFTALPIEVQEQYLILANEYLKKQKIHRIRLSTRPDQVDKIKCELLAYYNVNLVELGVQSLDDNVLLHCERGYSTDDVKTAIGLLADYNMDYGIQLMLGLPGDDYLSLSKTIKMSIQFAPKTIRIYPTLVIKDTKLAYMWQEGCYKPLSIKKAAMLAGICAKVFEKYSIKVIRVGLQASDDLNNPEMVLSGPYHSAFGELAMSSFYLQFFQYTQKYYPEFWNDARNDVIYIYGNKQLRSKVCGHKNMNIHYLKLDGYNVIFRETLTDGIRLFNGEKSLFGAEFEFIAYCYKHLGEVFKAIEANFLEDKLDCF